MRSGVRGLVAVSLGVLPLASAAGAAAPTITAYRAGITADSPPSRDRRRPGRQPLVHRGHRRSREDHAGRCCYEYSAGITAYSEPTGIAAGPDGNLWFTERRGKRVGKITTAGVVTEYSAGITAHSVAIGVAAGPDGNLWFTEGNAVGKITTAGVVTEYGAEVTVTVTVTGKGRITGGGISCPARCKATIPSGAKLTLRANAARGYRFAGWSGACAGLHACTLHPKAGVRVTAAFRKRHR